MASNGLKMESSYVKGEPGMEDLEMADIDEVGGYEDDTGELIFGKILPIGWLMRIPKDLWTTLASIDDDQEIQIGEIRTWESREPSGKPKETIRFHLNPQIREKDLSLVPKQYDLTTSTGTPKNTFVFSEKNLPGFKPRQQGAGRIGSSDILNNVDSREGSVKIEKRRGPRTIPKRTEYAGTIQREYVCTPRDNDEYRRIEYMKRTKGVAPRTGFVSDVHDSIALHNTGMHSTADDANFIHTITRRRPQENKATRMDKNKLLDAYGQLFKLYRYWPMSALKQRLNQPEAWLKETLAEVAVLVKTGTAANHYMLREENEYEYEGAGAKQEEMAPEVKDEEDEDDFGVDGVEFEDV